MSEKAENQKASLRFERKNVPRENSGDTTFGSANQTDLGDATGNLLSPPS